MQTNTEFYFKFVRFQKKENIFLTHEWLDAENKHTLTFTVKFYLFSAKEPVLSVLIIMLCSTREQTRKEEMFRPQLTIAFDFGNI